MVALNGRYDGKVIVPDTPLDLPANQRVRISVEPLPPAEDAAPAERPRTDFSAWIGLARRADDDRPHDPGADEDALWHNGNPSDGSAR